MTTTAPSPEAGHATLDTIAAMFGPLVRLALAHGVTVNLLEETLRRALVRAAREDLLAQGLAEHRLVSRISASTGLTRREVMRLSQAPAHAQPDVKGSPAAEVFTRWASAPRWPKVIQRSGAARSFDALARSVTQDVHPRTLLDELVRLHLVAVSDDGESVERLKDAFVPGNDVQQLLQYLAANVGGHLAGAVGNVLGDAGPRHFDQAIFADELAAASIPHVQAFVTGQWQRMLKEAVPLLEARIEHDQRAGLAQNRRIRIGLYTYEDEMPASQGQHPPDEGKPKPKPKSKSKPKTGKRRADHG